MEQIIITLHVLVAVFLVVLILIQQGKGASMGAAFGSGASQTVFGSQGSGGFLLKLTGLIAALFFATSLGLGYIATMHAKAMKKQTTISMPVPVQTAPVTTKAVPIKKVSPAQTTAATTKTTSNHSK